MCSTTLTEHQPLKRGGQISQHLLVHPNLQFIIVPHPCRKRSVTLEDCPATHLSSFTLLPSYPFYARLPLVSDAEEMHVFYNCLLHFAFPSSPPQRKKTSKKSYMLKQKVLCSFIHARLFPLWLGQHSC